MSGEIKEKWVRRILFAAILAAGLLITGQTARFTAREQARLHYLELHETAQHHTGELKRLMELYLGAGKNLAAFIGASPQLNNEQFQVTSQKLVERFMLRAGGSAPPRAAPGRNR